MKSQLSIGEYLIERLVFHGVRHVFGVPGDYILDFFKQLSKSSLQVINTCDEQGAGFAADAYARLNGLGVVVVTYNVGGLKVINTTAEAYAEQAPVLVISGAPGGRERLQNPLLHHKVNQYNTQMKIFAQITVASAELSEAENADREIERVIAAIQRSKRPGYLELPRDMATVEIEPRPAPEPPEPKSDQATLQEALEEALDKIDASEHPVIMVGEEMIRYGLSEKAIHLAEKTNIHLVVSIMSKSAVPETHPLYMGVYAGILSEDLVRQVVEDSDCIILLGVMLNEVNLGAYSANLEPRKIIHVRHESVTIAHHVYEEIRSQDFLEGLISFPIRPCHNGVLKTRQSIDEATVIHEKRKISTKRLFQILNGFLDCNMAVIADVGDALFGSIDLVTCRAANFLSPAYYASLGFAVPASLGVGLSDPGLRPVVLVGDGAFQMTGMELSTAVRYHLNPIVIVMNNGGYAMERPLVDGSFNDLLRWDYARLPELFGSGRGFTVETEGQFLTALNEARDYRDSFSILDVRLAPDDISPALKRLTQALAKKRSL